MELLVNEIQEEQSTARGDYYSLALFRDEDGTGIEFQRGVGGIYGQPETRTPPYCIVTSDQRAFYGGVQRVAWVGSVVEIQITEEARTVLRYPESHLAIRLELEAGDVDRVKTGLRRIFDAGDPESHQAELVGFDS